MNPHVPSAIKKKNQLVEYRRNTVACIRQRTVKMHKKLIMLTSHYFSAWPCPRNVHCTDPAYLIINGSNTVELQTAVLPFKVTKAAVSSFTSQVIIEIHHPAASSYLFMQTLTVGLYTEKLSPSPLNVGLRPPGECESGKLCGHDYPAGKPRIHACNKLIQQGIY